jgi:hypothetical protein
MTVAYSRIAVVFEKKLTKIVFRLRPAYDLGQKSGRVQVVLGDRECEIVAFPSGCSAAYTGASIPLPEQ